MKKGIEGKQESGGEKKGDRETRTQNGDKCLKKENLRRQRRITDKREEG